MIISKDSGDCLVISNKENSARFIEKDDRLVIDIVSKRNSRIFRIGDCGEYEVDGLCIYCKTHEDSLGITSVEVLIDDINILFLSNTFEYKKEIHDEIGQVNILILKTGGSFVYKECLNTFDPEVLIFDGNISDVEGYLKKVDISNYTSGSDLKFVDTDFGTEDFVLRTFILTKK
jgi:hypothetical protein